jgi:RNA polymerase sigma-70 factor (ECF subfamily)
MEILPNSIELAACAAAQSMGIGLRERADRQAGEQAGGREAAHRAAIGEMVERHARLVYRVAFAVVRNAADAEDAVQETFMQLLRGAPSRVIQDEQGYLARAAWRTACRISGRRRERAPQTEPAAERENEQPEKWLRELRATGPSPEQAAVQGDLEAWLHGQIDRLPEKLRQPLALAALGELTSPQIARVLGIPEGSVRRRIHAARQVLRRQMEMRKGGRA